MEFVSFQVELVYGRPERVHQGTRLQDAASAYIVDSGGFSEQYVACEGVPL